MVTACVGSPNSFELSRNYGHQPDGSFTLSKWDRGLSCIELNQALNKRFTQMARISKAERTARAGIPPTLMDAISWSNGSPTVYGKRFKRHQMLKAEAISYHAAMAAKPCPQTIDFEQQIATAAMPGSEASAGYLPASGPRGQTPDESPNTAPLGTEKTGMRPSL